MMYKRLELKINCGSEQSKEKTIKDTGKKP